MVNPEELQLGDFVRVPSLINEVEGDEGIRTVIRLEYNVTRKIRNNMEQYINKSAFINTPEAKEVNLEEALSKLDKDIKEFVTTEEFEKESKTCGHYWALAKHAFLLGLKSQFDPQNN